MPSLVCLCPEEPRLAEKKCGCNRSSVLSYFKKPPQRKCYTFVFLGFSHGLAVELQIKRNLLFDCDMVGIDPFADDTAHDFKLNVGNFKQARLQTWNGANNGSLAMVVDETLDNARPSQQVIAEHIFVTRVDGIYDFLPRMLEETGYSKYILACQLTVDIPRPSDRQLQQLIAFIQLIINEQRFTIMSVINIRNVLRVYLFNNYRRTCYTRYGI